MTTPSPTPTLTDIMPAADADLVRAHLDPAIAHRLDAALEAGRVIDAAMLAVNAAGRVDPDAPVYEELWRVYRDTMARHDARWRKSVTEAHEAQRARLHAAARRI